MPFSCFRPHPEEQAKPASRRVGQVPRAHPSRRRYAAPQDEGHPNNFAPEGASRCRALTSGLKGRAAGRKERLSEKWRICSVGIEKVNKTRRQSLWRIRQAIINTQYFMFAETICPSGLPIGRRRAI